MRARVGNPVGKPEAQEPHERQPVVDHGIRCVRPKGCWLSGSPTPSASSPHRRAVGHRAVGSYRQAPFPVPAGCLRNPPPAHRPRADRQGRSAAEAGHQHRRTPPQPPSKSPIAVNSRMESQSRRNGEVNRSVQLGRVEYVHVETVGEILIEELHAQLPFREVPGLDRFPQLARWKSGSAPLILTASFHTLIADRASASR